MVKENDLTRLCRRAKSQADAMRGYRWAGYEGYDKYPNGGTVEGSHIAGLLEELADAIAASKRIDAGQLDDLGFGDLRGGNIRRLPLFRNKRGELAHSECDGSDWSPAQWLQAVAGELGEYANLRKKYERGDIDSESFYPEAANELADVVVYLDILAFQLGINLGEAVRDKFNAVSDRVECDVKI